MTERDQLLSELKFLDTALENTTKVLADVSQRLGNGAILKQPGAHTDDEMFELQAKLTKKASDILDRAQAVHDQMMALYDLKDGPSS